MRTSDTTIRKWVPAIAAAVALACVLGWCAWDTSRANAGLDEAKAAATQAQAASASDDDLPVSDTPAATSASGAVQVSAAQRTADDEDKIDEALGSLLSWDGADGYVASRKKLVDAGVTGQALTDFMPELTDESKADGLSMSYDGKAETWLVSEDGDARTYATVATCSVSGAMRQVYLTWSTATDGSPVADLTATVLAS